MRALRSVCVAALAGLTSLAAPGASASESEQHFYVADVAQADSFFLHTPETPVGTVDLAGRFHVWDPGRSVTLEVDDRGVLDGGEIYVAIWSPTGRLFAGCLEVRHTMTYRPGPHDRWVTFDIGQPGYIEPPCSAQATVGVATVTRRH